MGLRRNHVHAASAPRERTGPWLEWLRGDLLYAFRSNRKKPRVAARTIVIPKPPEEGRLTFTPGTGLLAISRDGECVVYRAVGAAGQALYLRDRGQLNFTRLQDTDTALTPFFSRNGEWVGFATVPRSDGTAELKRVSVHGGSVSKPF